MTDAAGPAPRPALPLPEFVALMAMLTATVAFSIDAMLPALPAIGAALSPDAPLDAQWIVTGFILGMGGGTLFAGALSDAWGRKPVMLAGAALYCAAAAAATLMPTLDGVVAARIVQGVGAAGPRVVAQAMIRDQYAGRGMARVSSFVMMVFVLIPAVAHLMGSIVIDAMGWRSLFWVFVAFAAVSATWLVLRQPETLPRARRRPLRVRALGWAAREVVRSRRTVVAVAAQTLVLACLFSTLVSIQPIYDRAFGRADSFPVWFAVVAVISGGASFLNAMIVERVGMLYVLRRALALHVVLSILVALGHGALGPIAFPAFVLWSVGTFSLAGLCIGNLTAIAMEPLGHVAGMASSLVASVATVASVMLAAPVGQAFDGTPVPLFVGVAVFAAGALACVLRLREGDV